MNRIFSADLIFTSNGPAISKGWIETDTSGKIISVNEGGIPKNAEIFKGAIVPGLINTHCHLELSHLRGCINEKEGMSAFIRSIIRQRFTALQEEQIAAMISADIEMYKNGIVAVGDISNFEISHEVKKQSKIYYHTFVEVLGLDTAKAEEIILKGNKIVDLFSQSKSYQSNLVPHSSYSVSDLLFELLRTENNSDLPASIHMEESLDEYEFCATKTGPFAKLFGELGIDISSFKSDAELTPLQLTLPKLISENNWLFVHNTFVTETEIKWAETNCKNIFWCLCPNANLFITNKIPNLDLFNNDYLNVTIGTDSLASNYSLNIIDELKIIQQNKSTIPFERLIKWATINGAKFLGIENIFGSISVGKKPGLVLLEGIDEESLKLNDNVKVRRLI